MPSRLYLAIAAGIVLGLLSLAAAEDSAGLLKEHGIRIVGDSIQMVEEAELSKSLREVTKLKKAVIDAQKALTAIEKQVDDNQKLIVQYTNQRRQINAALGAGNLSITQHNRLVALFNELGERINLLIQKGGMEEELKTARAKLYQAREEYVSHVLNMRKLADIIEQKYDTVSGNPQLKDAVLAAGRSDGKEINLEPSRTFQANVRSLAKIEDTVLSESIPLRTDGSQTYYVAATINGKHTKEMMIDSGASFISLPFAMARGMGIELNSSDPRVQLQLADGSIIEATLIKLDEVRVGKFAVENVEAVVMPPTAPDAAALLGMSYLGKFSFKIESDQQKLTMTKVEDK